MNAKSQNAQVQPIKLDFLKWLPADSLDVYIERVREGIRKIREIEGS